MKNNKAALPDMHYLTSGEEGTPAILIHGMGGSCRGWSYQIPVLIEAGYQVFALDLPGHGDSHKPTDQNDYHIEVIYDQLLTWIERRGLNQPALFVGHSMGGYLSFRYALDHPGKVRGMVLIDPFYSFDQLYPLFQISAKRPRLSATVYQRAPDWALRTMVALLKKYTVSVPTKVVRQMQADLTKASHRIVYTAPTVQNLLPALPSIETPALVVWGKRDLTLTPDSFPPVVEALPNASGLEIGDAGHTPHLSSTDTFNLAMTKFLHRLSGKHPMPYSPETASQPAAPSETRPRGPIRRAGSEGLAN